jgi:PEGA domain
LREADASGGAVAARLGTLAVSVTRDPEGGSAEQSGRKLRRFQTAALVIGLLGVVAVVGFGGARFGRGAGRERAVDAASSVPMPGPATASVQAPSADGTTTAASSVTEPAPPPRLATSPTSSRLAPSVSSPSAPQPHRPVPASPPAPAFLPTLPGTLNVVSSPSWATVLLDGKVVGQTPIVVSGVAAGTHSIEGRALGVGSPEIRSVTVQSDAVTRVELGGAR